MFSQSSPILTRAFLLPPVRLLFLVLLLQGCSAIPFTHEANILKARELAASHQYARALSLANKQLAKSPESGREQQWQAMVDEITGQAQQFKRAEFSEIDRFLEQQEWLQANERVQRLREQLPRSEELESYLASFDRSKQRHIAKLHSALLLLQSRYIPEQVDLQRQLHHASPNDPALRRQWQRALAEREQILASLQQQLDAAEAAGQIDTALLYARAVARLAATPQAEEVVAGLQRRLAASATGIAAQGEPQSSEQAARYQQQLNQYGRALVNEEWLQARAVLDALLKARPQDSELLGQDTYIKEVFAEQVDAAKKSGEQMYSSGEIEKALELWQGVLPMAPGDAQLIGNIERAQRILSKVKALKEESL